MAKLYDELTPKLQAFIQAQHLFFVATAPLSPEGHVNLSPKGLDSFRILSPHQVAYLDLTGSGNETSAHLLENGRITLMFCAFTDPPSILRLYGQGKTLLPGMADFDKLQSQFPTMAGIRQLISVEIDRIQTSCGFAVPLYEYQGQRQQLVTWAEGKGEAGLQAYRHQKNRMSIDQLLTPLGLQ